MKWVDRFFKAIEALCALMLAVMVALVFGNVVLRYGFNAGITVSEEVSRWLFLWMTFLGAVVALREHRHLGVDMVVQRLPPAGKKLCLLLAYAVMLYIVWLMFEGGLAQTRINWDVVASTTGASMAIVHLSAVAFAVLAAGVLLGDLWRLASGHMSDDELVMVQESEEALQLQQILGRAGEAAPQADADAGGVPVGRPR